MISYTGATTPGQSGPGRNCYDEILRIPQSCIAQSAGIVEYTECAFAEGSYLSTPPLRQDMTQGQFLSGV